MRNASFFVRIKKMNKKIFDDLAELFNSHNYRLYMIGGTTRDFLLNKEVYDYDFVTDATPDEMKSFLTDANYVFAKYGTVKVKVDGVHVDITTLRKESGYIDSRHPNEIIFTKNLEEDYIRRDFTINAIYLDEKYNPIDFCRGILDLKNKVIRFIGDPVKRIKEDPLRILRAERFKEKLGFEYEEKTAIALKENHDLINKLNPDKIKEENRKLHN